MTGAVAAGPRCPHCGVAARAERSSFFRWRCGVCGGPVVVQDGRIVESTPGLAGLVRAHRARAMAFGWFAAAIVFGSIATLMGGLALLLWPATHGAAVLLGGVAAVALVVAVTGRAKGARRNAEARQDLEAAWQATTSERP